MARPANVFASGAKIALYPGPVSATVGCKVIRAALLAATAAGIEIPAFLARHRIEPTALADPDARFAYDVSLGMWREIDESGAGAFGLRAAMLVPEGHFDVIDYVVSASKDLGEGMRRFERYFGIVSTGAAHVVVEAGEHWRLERRQAPDAHTTIPHPAEFAFACIILRSRKMTGVAFRPVEVRFAHRAPVSDREHREVFDCPVRFDAATSAITFDRKTLELPMLGAQPELARILERHAETVIAALPKADGDLRSRTKEAIVAGLKAGKGGVGDAAKELGMSERTLQRRLGELSTSHAKLLDEARADLALRYLGERSIAIAEVAFLLGFADVPSFHRAFKRWTNTTPGEHRRSLS